jgi:hypothetical protein
MAVTNDNGEPQKHLNHYVYMKTCKSPCLAPSNACVVFTPRYSKEIAIKGSHFDEAYKDISETAPFLLSHRSINMDGRQRALAHEQSQSRSICLNTTSMLNVLLFGQIIDVSQGRAQDTTYLRLRCLDFHDGKNLSSSFTCTDLCSS